jgi:hypothetical protein
VKFLTTPHPIKIEQALADNCVAVENFVELAQLKKENFLEIVLLDFPKLVHARGKVFPVLRRDEKSSGIISCLSYLYLVFVSDMLWL